IPASGTVGSFVGPPSPHRPRRRPRDASLSGQSPPQVTRGSVQGHTPVRRALHTTRTKIELRTARPGSGAERPQVGGLGTDLTARVGRGRFVQTGVFLPLGALVRLELLLDRGPLPVVTTGR